MSRIFHWLAFHPVCVAVAFLVLCWAITTAISGSANPWHLHDVAGAIGGLGGYWLARSIQVAYYLKHRPAAPTIEGEAELRAAQAEFARDRLIVGPQAGESRISPPVPSRQ